MQGNHRIGEVPQCQRPLVFDSPHRLPRRRQKLFGSPSGVVFEVSLRRDVFVRGPAFEGLPRGFGGVQKFRQSAVNNGQFAGIAADRDRFGFCSGTRENRMFVINAAAEIQSRAGFELPQGVFQRLPRFRLTAVPGIVTFLTVNEHGRSVRSGTIVRHGERPHGGMRADRRIRCGNGC